MTPPEESMRATESDGSPGLAARLVASLRERIVQWQYPPGFRITEEELCREFGMSRSPVREALKVLAANGFVEQLPRRGYAVRQLDVREIEELYEVRLALELMVVERLASRDAPGEGIADARREWTAQLETPATASSDTLARLDERFHEGLAAVLGNETLLHQLRSINKRLLIFRSIDFARPGRVEETCRQHLAVLDRIAAGDVPGARGAMERNIMAGCAIVETSIADALARAYRMTSRGGGRNVG
ncbi:MAG: GntR family transcriptional regulator [Proteobacteria bacterium]|nr:MAG: GntR family transcriptional regulator [Pseudomonadota bacterium]